MILVLDASVIIKWFNKEKDSNIALRIREEYYRGMHEIVVPDLLLYEISNALRYNNEFSVSDISKAVDSIIDIGITITVPERNLLDKAVVMARKENITVYDAVYIALASEINAKFITADEKLKHIKGVTFITAY